MWQITATITSWSKARWEKTTQIPTFFLDGKIQGILTASHAEHIAYDVINPLNDLNVRVSIHAMEI